MTQLSPKLEALAAAMESTLGSSLTRHDSSTGELTYLVDTAQLVAAATVLRDDEAFRFDMLMDVCGVDYLSYGRAEWDSDSATNTGFSRGVHRGQDSEIADPDTKYSPPGRFASVYHLLSIEHNHRLRLKCFCSDEHY